MTMDENGIRVVFQEKSQICNDAANMTLIDAETGVRYEHFIHFNDDTGET